MIENKTDHKYQCLNIVITKGKIEDEDVYGCEISDCFGELVVITDGWSSEAGAYNDAMAHLNFENVFCDNT